MLYRIVLVFSLTIFDRILGLVLGEANDALEGLGLAIILGGGRPLEGGPFALDDIVRREVVGQGDGTYNGVGAVVGAVADNGQLDGVFDNIAAFDGGIDQTGIDSADLEVDLLADVLVVVDLHGILQFSSVFGLGLTILAGYLERGLIECLVGKTILALNGDFLGDSGAHLRTVNLDLGALVRSKNFLQDEPVALELLGQLVHAERTLAIGIDALVSSGVSSQGHLHLDDAVFTVTRVNTCGLASGFIYGFCRFIFRGFTSDFNNFGIRLVCGFICRRLIYAFTI